MDVPSGAGTIYPSGAPEFNPGFFCGVCVIVIGHCVVCSSIYRF